MVGAAVLEVLPRLLLLAVGAQGFPEPVATHLAQRPELLAQTAERQEEAARQERRNQILGAQEAPALPPPEQAVKQEAHQFLVVLAGGVAAENLLFPHIRAAAQAASHVLLN